MGDTWERFQLASARVPFRLKTAVVWLILFGVLAFFGNAAGFDLQWIRDNFRYIAGGLRYTMVIALGGIVLAIVLALLGALARISRNPVPYAIAGFYVSFFRGTPLIVQMFLLYLALPPVGRNLAARVLVAARGVRPGADPRRRDRRHASPSASTTAPT